MRVAVVVNGAGGRMGRLVATELRRAGFGDVAGCDPAARPPLHLEDGPLDLVEDLVGGVQTEGVVVDFSHPNATPDLVRAARERRARLVIGTTGQSPEQLRALEGAAREVPVVLARNFSIGINRLVQVLPGLGVLARHGFDVECIEAHHRQKRDAPSGTAGLLLDALLGPDAPRVHGRHGAEARRAPGEVGVHSLRAGEIPGEHTLVLAGDHEVIEVRHRALDRAAFASGVVPAVRFVGRRAPGLYTMSDVMGDVG